MSKKAIEHYEAALKEAFPSGATGDAHNDTTDHPTIPFEDPRVQVAYEIMCSDLSPPPEEHWEGFAARRIVEALFTKQETDQAITAMREALAEKPAPMIRGDIRDGLVDDEPAQQEPVAWVYSEGLEALKNGKPWTAYGTKQEANNIALYLHPTPECEPYAWVTFTPYGDEDDVWYENPEGQLLEGWTYKPLYDTAPPRREWVGLTDELDVKRLNHCMIAVRDWLGGGCDINDIPRPEIAALVAFTDYGITKGST